MKRILLFATFLVAGWAPIAWAASDTGEAVPRERYANREILLDPTAKDCPETTRSLVQVRDNLYRHTNAEIPFRHSGLVLITSEGALVIDPALTCTATWLRDEIKTRFNVDVRYLIQTHAHFDHIAGSQVFQEAGATVVAHRNAVEPIVGEKLPTAVPGKVFDKEMTIELGGETIKLYHVAPSHSNSMVMVLFPRHRALQCSDVCESRLHRIWTSSISTMTAGFCRSIGSSHRTSTSSMWATTRRPPKRISERYATTWSICMPKC